MNLLALQQAAAQQSQVKFWDDAAGYEATPQETWSPWDIALIDGKPLPGLAKVVIRKKPRIKVQKRKESGTDGDRPILLGYEPAELAIELHIWTPDQLLALQQFTVNATLMSSGQAPTYRNARLLETPKLSRAQSDKLITVAAVRVSHPSLTLANISEMFIYSISPFEDGPTHGMKLFRIEGYERFELKSNSNNAQAKTSPSAGGAFVGQNPNNLPPTATKQPTKAGYPAGKNASNYQLVQSPETAALGYTLTPGSDPGAISPITRLGQ